MDRFGQKENRGGFEMPLRPPEFPEIEKQRETSLRFKIKLKHKEQEKTTGCSTVEGKGRYNGSPSTAGCSGASEEGHLIPCPECNKLFPSLKALFGHLRVHRKARRIDTKPSTAVPPRQKRQRLDEDFMAAEALMMMRHSQSDNDIKEAKLCLLQWVCSKIKRESGGRWEEEKKKEIEEKKNLVMPMDAVMPENVQRLTALRMMKKKNKKKAFQLAVDFDLNEPAEVECLDL